MRIFLGAVSGRVIGRTFSRGEEGRLRGCVVIDGALG